jgi:transposase
MSKVRFVGLDVHADTIAVAVAEAGGEVRSLGIIPNRLESIRMISKLAPIGALKCCYEAGPTGYVLYWQLVQLGVACEVIAPSLIPTKSGERVKTDRRDAEKLARWRIDAVWVPDANHEALRDLVRAREAAKKDQLRHRHRLGKFLLRHGKRPIDAGGAWTQKYLDWIRIHVHFEQPALEATVQHYREEVDHIAERICKLEQAIDEAVKQAPAEIQVVIQALQALRGVAQTTAATVVAELGSLARFQSPRQLMGYSGLVSSEYSSGSRVQRGAITKSGNAHLRRVLVDLDVPASAECAGPRTEKAEVPGAEQGSQTHRLEGATAAAQTLHRIGGSRQGKQRGRYRHRPGVARVHVGHRRAHRITIPTSQRQGGLSL